MGDHADFGGGNYVEPYFATKALIVAPGWRLDISPRKPGSIGLAATAPDGLFRTVLPAPTATPTQIDYAARLRALPSGDFDLALWMQTALSHGAPDWHASGRQPQHHAGPKQTGETAQWAAGCVSHFAAQSCCAVHGHIEVYAALKDVARGPTSSS